jgi:tetratricopeptide (TPR) repeat protein
MSGLPCLEAEMKQISLTLAFLLCATTASAQHGHGGKGSPARLMEGMGNHHHPIATSSPEAQKFFDQGMNFVWGFNHEEAARSFQRAAELDPKAAMPHWGIALALGPNINLNVDPEREKAAREETDKALALSQAGPENERAYILALDKRYSTAPQADLKQLARDFSKAMGELSRRYPDDLDAATLYAESLMDLHPWRLWSADGTPNEGTLEIISVLESVLRRDPNHLGANHYYIHAVEASPHPERALASAQRLETLAPGAGHLVHMPAHVYIRMGDYRGAMQRNAVAAEADRAYIKATGANGVYPLMYYTHNLQFLAAAACFAGRREEARQAAALMMENITPALKQMPMLEWFALMPTFIELRFRRWKELLEAPRPDQELPLEGAMWHFARGLASAATGDLKGADAERAAFRDAARAVPSNMTVGGVSPEAAHTIHDLAGHMLDARIAEARGDRKAAIASWTKAVEIQDRLPYDEPPIWYYPVRESLGATLLRDSQAVEAEKVFRTDLDKNPRNGRSLFGLWQSLLAQKKTFDASWVQREFEEAWKGADAQLALDDL